MEWHIHRHTHTHTHTHKAGVCTLNHCTLRSLTTDFWLSYEQYSPQSASTTTATQNL